MYKLLSAVGISVFAFVAIVFAAQPAPYAGQQQREIKALAADEIQSYLAGKGAGLAKAAELNHYPGPAHVLELADKLQLTEEQKSRTTAIFDSMQKAAIRHGTALVEKERELDRQFAAGTVTKDSLGSTLRQIGELQAELRKSHLQAHIEQRAILTKTQIAKYDQLRGYTSHSASESGGHSHKH